MDWGPMLRELELNGSRHRRIFEMAPRAPLSIFTSGRKLGRKGRPMLVAVGAQRRFVLEKGDSQNRVYYHSS